MTPDEFVRDYGNYRSNEMNPYGKIGKALEGWRDAERRLSEIAQIIESAKTRHGSFNSNWPSLIALADMERIERLAKGAE